MSAEVIAIRLGSALVARAASLWMAGRLRDQDLALGMDELIRRRIPGLRSQRSVQRQFEQIADAVAARVEPMLAHEFRGLDAGERSAVVDAVVAAFERTELSDAVIFESDADPARLARRIRETIAAPAGLSEAGSALYDQLVAECCDCYVRIVRHLPVFTERAMTELLGRISTLGQQLGEVLDRLPRRSLHAPEGTDHDDEFRREYCALISAELDDVELLSFATEHPLHTKLSVAYISLRATADADQSAPVEFPTMPPAVRPLEIPAWPAEASETGGVRVETALSRKPRVLLRGEAGSGKTTLLRWLAVTAARGTFTNELKSWNGLIPVLIKLRSYAARELPRLDELLDNSVGLFTSHLPRAWIDRQMAAGRVLLLVDGLDEIAPAQRNKVRLWLRRLLRVYGDTRVVVTTRPAAANQNWLANADFTSISLERMSPADLGAFIRQWHRAVAASGQRLPCEEADLPDYERALISSIQDRPHLYALASSPLLAAMLCSLHLSRNRQLPRSRMELYRIAVELLLERRDADREVPTAQGFPLSLVDKISVLSDLAWRLSDNNLTEFDLRKAHAHVATKIASMRHLDVSPEVVVDYLVNRSGILRSPAAGTVDFVHRSFQEYLAATDAAAEDRIGNLIERGHHDAWHDTIIMTAGHANSSQRRLLLDGILDRAAADSAAARPLQLLAVACMETIESLSAELIDRLDGTVARLIPPRRIDECVSLSAAGEAVLRHLPAELTELSEAGAAATIRTAALIGGPTALGLLSGYALDERGEARRELMSAWPYYDPDEFATEVLAKVPAPPGISLRLSHSSQWRPGVRLSNLRSLIVDYPANLGSLALGELPMVPIVSIRRLFGNNDLRALAEIPNPDQPRRIVLHTNSDQAVISHPEGLAELPGLFSLDLTGWSTLPSLSDFTLPDTLRWLRLTAGPADGDLSFVVEHVLDDLDLTGADAAHALARVGRASELARLKLADCDLVEDIPALLQVIPHVTSLELYRVELPGDLGWLSELPMLQGLYLISCTAKGGGALDMSTIPQPTEPRQLTVCVEGSTPTVGAMESNDRITFQRRTRDSAGAATTRAPG